jgi:hypothetical protein
VDILDLDPGTPVRHREVYVGVAHRRRTPRGAGPWIGGLIAAVALLAILAMPIAAVSSKTKLSNATVTPRTGGTTTTFVFTVVYQNANGSRANIVNVVVGGVTHQMSAQAGGSWGKGMTFKWSGKLPAGQHNVVIDAQAKDKSEASLPAGQVTVTAPASATPRPTPKPTPKPTPTPEPTRAPRTTPPPTPTDPPTTGPTAPSPTPTSAPGGLPGSVPTPTPTDASGTPAPTSGPPDVLLGGLIGAVTPGSTGGGGSTGGNGDGAPTGPISDSGSGAPDGAVGPGGGPGGAAGGGDRHGAWGPVTAVLTAAGLPTRSPFGGFALAPTLMTTSAAVGGAMALGLFGARRRREDDPPDELMAASSANGVAVAAYDLIANNAAVAAAANAEVMDMEALLPRWRRPSLLQARKADPIRDTGPGARLTFDEGFVGALSGRERRVIRYRVVRLLDTPDELRGQEIGYLDQGDEVQLVEKYGAYWLVLAPDGQQGWLHKMVLGEIIDRDAGTNDRPTASMNTAADSWTMGESDVDNDVLEAYLESRRRGA